MGGLGSRVATPKTIAMSCVASSVNNLRSNYFKLLLHSVNIIRLNGLKRNFFCCQLQG